MLSFDNLIEYCQNDSKISEQFNTYFSEFKNGLRVSNDLNREIRIFCTKLFPNANSEELKVLEIDCKKRFQNNYLFYKQMVEKSDEIMRLNTILNILKMTPSERNKLFTNSAILESKFSNNDMQFAIIGVTKDLKSQISEMKTLYESRTNITLEIFRKQLELVYKQWYDNLPNYIKEML